MKVPQVHWLWTEQGRTTETPGLRKISLGPETLKKAPPPFPSHPGLSRLGLWAAHLVEVSDLGVAPFVQVEPRVDGQMQPAIPVLHLAIQHQGGVRGEDGGKAASTEECIALLQGCIAEVLEVLEGGVAIWGAEGGSHTGDMAFIPAVTVGRGGWRKMQLHDNHSSSQTGPWQPRVLVSLGCERILKEH